MRKHLLASGIQTGKTRRHRGPEILCDALSSRSLLCCRTLGLVHLLLQGLAARKWLETRGLVTTRCCRCIKVSLVKARLICIMKQLGCDKRRSAVLRAAKRKGLPAPKLPTSIMVSACRCPLTALQQLGFHRERHFGCPC